MSTEQPGPIPLPVGKLPAALLDRLLRAAPAADPRVVVGPRLGEDAAVLDLGDRYLVATSDPITFTAEAIGWYAVQVNANDLAVRGAEPAWFLMTLLLPEGRTPPALAERIFAEVDAACRAVGATLVGGHTEITAGLARPLLAGTMLGEVARERLVTTAGSRPGDAILLSKGIAVEGTSILARDGRLSGLEAGQIDRARGLLVDPGISILREARIALAAAPVHAMHDPTEGGLATGLFELAVAGGVGLEVEAAAIPVLPECAAACEALGLDPLGLLASGSLLAVCPAGAAAGLLDAWRREGIAGAAIGRILPEGAGCWVIDRRGRRPLPRFARDELARLLEG
jgi:hydrogenase maturation factor